MNLLVITACIKMFAMFNLATMFATARLDTAKYSGTYFQASALACSYLEETLKDVLSALLKWQRAMLCMYLYKLWILELIRKLTD